MLRILLSHDHITLCRKILEEIGERVERREKGLLLIVPEQYSFDMERQLAAFGDETCLYAEVLSLSRLAGRAESVYGGAAALRLDQGGRLLTADLAVDQAFPRLKFYASTCRRPEFLESFLSAVDEWESYNLLPQDLLDASERFTGRFAQKLQELGLLYEGYRTACGVAQDPVLRLRYLCDILENEDFLSDKNLYIYGFSDFTALEHEILEACVAGAQNVTLALPWEGKLHEMSFPQTGDLLKALRNFCRNKEIGITEQEIPVIRERPKGLAALQDSLSSLTKPHSSCDDASVSFVKYQNAEDECRATAVQIRKLLRSGARCREIGVACADPSNYRATLRDVLRDAGIPAFFSGKTSLAANAGARIVLLALRAVEGGFDRRDVLSYLKSGISDDDSCDMLEAYAILWNIRGNAWLSPWEKNPSGVKDSLSEEESALLHRLNAVREEMLRPLSDLRESLRRSADVSEMVRAVYAFLLAISLKERLSEAAAAFRKNSDAASAQQYEQIYDLLLDALEQLCLVDGKQVKNIESFCALLEKLLERCGVASIPGTLDQVLVDDVPSFRGRAVRHLFILGASEGVFPACGPDHGIFTEPERKQLRDAGVAMAPTRDYVISRELNGVFQAIRSAESSVCISCAGNTPSYLIDRFAEGFGGFRTSDAADAPLNCAEAAGRSFRGGCGDLPAEAVRCRDAFQSRLRDDFGTVSEEHLHRLYHDVISLSPTSSDLYSSCRFAYFLKHGLNAETLETADFDARQFGNFVHFVLEKTVDGIKMRGGFHALADDAWKAIAESAAETYIKTCFRDLKQMDHSTEYFIKQAKKEALRAAESLAEEMRQTEFEPFATELKFGKNGALPAIPISGEHAKCELKGTADRVDVLRRDDGDYIRVVDYKTGKKDFDYTNLDVGKEMQLLLYLYALRRDPPRELGEHPKAAGIFYQPVGTAVSDFSEVPSPDQLRDKQDEAHQRKGVVLNDLSVLEAMEKDLEHPRILPLKRSKSGQLTGNLVTDEEMHMLENYVSRKLGQIADGVMSGVVTPNPIEQKSKFDACKYCDYSAVCQKDRMRVEKKKIKSVNQDAFFARLRGEEHTHG